MDDEQVLMDERATGMSELHSHFVIVNILLCLGNFETNHILLRNAEILENDFSQRANLGERKCRIL